MSLTECIDKCIKLENFEKLERGDFVRYISFNKLSGEWEYKNGGYFKKCGINCNNIPYIVMYNFDLKRTLIISQWKILDDDTRVDGLFFYDPNISKRNPPYPKYQRKKDCDDDTITDKDLAIIALNEKVEELRTEIKYLSNKVKLYEKENKIMRVALHQK